MGASVHVLWSCPLSPLLPNQAMGGASEEKFGGGRGWWVTLDHAARAHGTDCHQGSSNKCHMVPDLRGHSLGSRQTQCPKSLHRMGEGFVQALGAGMTWGVEGIRNASRQRELMNIQ